MTSRRGFLSFIGAALASATLDPERLLWVPGAKTISIPEPRDISSEDISSEVIAAMFEQVRPKLQELFSRDDAKFQRFFARLAR